MPIDDKTREHRNANRRKRRAADPALRQRERERARAYEARRWYDPVHRIKAQARKRSRIAIADGRIERQNCVLCGTAETVPHHPDYSRPFFFVWLCKEHHALAHRLARAGDILGVAAIERHATETVPVHRPKVIFGPGAAHPNAKLTLAQVDAIRRSTEPSGALAERFNIGRGQISNIRSGRTWRTAQPTTTVD